MKARILFLSLWVGFQAHAQFGAPIDAEAAQGTQEARQSLTTAQTSEQGGDTSARSADSTLAPTDVKDAQAQQANANQAAQQAQDAANKNDQCAKQAQQGQEKADKSAAAMQALAALIQAATCAPLLSNQYTAATGAVCMAESAASLAMGLAQMDAAKAPLAEQQAKCEKNKKAAEGLKPGIASVGNNAGGKIGSAGTGANGGGGAAETAGGVSDGLAAAALSGTSLGTSGGGVTPHLGSAGSTGNGSGPGYSDVALGGKESGAASKSGKDGSGDMSFSAAEVGKFLGNKSGGATPSGLIEARTGNGLDMRDANGASLTLWQRATRRYLGEKGERYMSLARPELLRKMVNSLTRTTPLTPSKKATSSIMPASLAINSKADTRPAPTLKSAQ